MTIDKIGNINNIIEPKKSNPVTNANKTKKKDSIQISSEGKMAAQVSKLTQAVRETSDIRVERVQQIKEQIANGSYNFNDPQILEQVADRIANFLLRK